MNDKKLHSNFDYESALNVQKGIEQPKIVNESYVSHVKALKKAEPTVEELVTGIVHGNRTLLSQAITLVESTLQAHQEKAQSVIEHCLPYSGKSIRLGITGVPGAGKSSIIETLGKMLTSHNQKVAVLAIDPSSERSGGSILGDKTRMEELSIDPNAFIRPSPSAGSLGGVARKTREIIVLCEAAGFDIIIVETVGVGQSEVAAHSMVDFFLLLQLANTGDELQGIKRGIMEMADMIAINKSDIDHTKSELAASQFRNALHLFPMPESGWMPKVMLCSARTHKGIEELWNNVMKYILYTKGNGFFYKKRQEQNIRILYETINTSLCEHFYTNPLIKEELIIAKNKILSEKISGYKAAELLIQSYFEHTSNKNNNK